MFKTKTSTTPSNGMIVKQQYLFLALFKLFLMKCFLLKGGSITNHVPKQQITNQYQQNMVFTRTQLIWITTTYYTIKSHSLGISLCKQNLYFGNWRRCRFLRPWRNTGLGHNQRLRMCPRRTLPFPSIYQKKLLYVTLK